MREANSLIRSRPPSEERSPPLKLILIFLLLSSEMVFRIVIEDLFSWFDYGLGHLNFTKNLVLFLFTFQMKTRKLCNFNNHAAFSRNHHYVVNNSGLIYHIQPKSGITFFNNTAFKQF